MTASLPLNTALAALAAVLIAGCASPGRHSATPPPLSPAAPTAMTQPGNPAPETLPDRRGPQGPLSLAQAVSEVLSRAPELTVQAYELQAAEALQRQARALPNPELVLEMEEYNRDGEGTDSAETVIALGQLFELGGKRRWRTNIAETEHQLATWDYESTRLDLLAETARRFIEVLAAQQRAELEIASVELAKQTRKAVDARVEAGREPPLQAAKSAAEVEIALMDAREAHSALEVARMRLAAMWGADGATFDHAEGRLERFATTVPTWKTLQERIKANPDLARWQTERDLHHAELMAERAARIPDLSAAVAYQQYREDDTDALAFGVGMPLPLFDRNQGNIAAATHRIARTEAERSVAALALSTQLREQHTTLVAAHQRATTLGLTVVPAMEQSLEAARLGYQQGKFGFLDMLDAQRGLFEVRADLLDALSAYHIALTEIQRTTGTHLTELWNQE